LASGEWDSKKRLLTRAYAKSPSFRGALSDASRQRLHSPAPLFSDSEKVVNVVLAFAGLVLLLFGRRLFWLFVALAGFGAGMYVAHDYFQMESPGLSLAIALLAGVLGALLSIFLQKLAVGVAGFAAGGYLAALLLKNLNAESFAWIGFIIGGVLGALFLLTLFEWALIILSSLVGAAFVADGLATPQTALGVFGAALVIGIIVQRMQLPDEKKPRAERSRAD
jgi:hypothetical protein